MTSMSEGEDFVYRIKSLSTLIEKIITILRSNKARAVEVSYHSNMPDSVPVVVFHDDDFELFDVNTYVLTDGKAEVVGHYLLRNWYGIYMVSAGDSRYIVLVRIIRRYDFEWHNTGAITVYGDKQAYEALRNALGF